MTSTSRQEGYLVVEFQGDVVRTIPLTFDVLTVGRSPDSDLSLQHPGVSRRHAELSLGPSGLLVTDLESANGSYVDGVRILPHEPTRVDAGQILQLGPFFFAIRRSPADAPDGVRPLAGDSARPRAQRDGSATAEAAVAPTFPRRPTLPVPPPARRDSKYLDYLPAVFAENDFLGRYLLIFESIWETLEQRQDHVDMYFDPRTCPEAMLPWIAGWFDLKTGFHWPEARKRHLVEQVSELYAYRGTAYGLAKIIEIWTGATPQITEDPNQPFVFRVRLTLPAGVEVDRELVEDLLNEHKPAASGYVLEIAHG
jgi:phage tail-like protein